MKRRIFTLLLILALTVCMTTGCKESTPVIETADYFSIDYSTSKTIYFEIELDDGNVLGGELYPTVAPITVRNFVTLAESGFYDGRSISRTVNDVLIQGGLLDDGEKAPYYLRGEFSSNGWNNTLKHTRGVISMARKDDVNSAYSSFFIMLDKRSSFDGEYAAFGRITSGMVYADNYGDLDDGSEKPTETVTIKTIRILGN